ncbi:MerR family transcriptional regulator [Saccharomonospora sp. NB11]|jgi:DNA-binding transcriptional MerR regulator|uniref:MerR family transcriptional regulator n=1 Tax=Saccharomonospora sp. NB11 TaxID=1642298 RepID=UPI001E45C7A0|nr:MerR family transcriptional regulator [Saccharomonospora sp. NB11]
MMRVDTDVKFKSDELLTIGQLAQATGVSTRSIRYYEERGLVVSHRLPSGHRRFVPECVERIVLIQYLFAAGLTSATIEPLLPCMLDESQRTDFLIGELRRHRDRLTREIRQQQETVRILDEVIAEYDGG